MEKVKLTQKQADAIVKNINEGLENGDILYRYLRYEGYDEQFRGLTFGALADALYVGYEVDSQFKVGDWVYVNWSNRGAKKFVFKIVDFTKRGRMVIDNEESNTTPSHMIVRHATPTEIKQEKERRWWKKHGREVDEYKPKDIVINCDGYIGEVQGVSNENSVSLYYDVLFDENSDPLTFHCSDLKIICFADERKDIKA